MSCAVELPQTICLPEVLLLAFQVCFPGHVAVLMFGEVLCVVLQVLVWKLQSLGKLHSRTVSSSFQEAFPLVLVALLAFEVGE